MRIIAVINQKGGSGKTTSAINLAAVFAKRGQRTLLVDVDPQSHCALGLAVPEQQIELHVGDAMLAPDDRPLDLKRLIWPVNKSLDLMLSTTRLAGLEAARGGLADREDRDFRLAALLRRFEGVYEWVVIDCPPSIGLLTFNALRASSEILVPVETGYFALRGATKQIATIRALCRRFGQAPPYRVLPTMHDENSTLSCDVLAELERRFKDCLLPVTVRFDLRLKEAASMGSPVVEFAPRSTGAADYSALASYLTENTPVPLRLDDAEPADGHETATKSRAVVSIDLFNEEPVAGQSPAATASGANQSGSAHGSHGSPAAAGGGAFFRPAGTPDAPPSPISRAAELAARAKRILQKSEELTQRLASDPLVAKAILDGHGSTAMATGHESIGPAGIETPIAAALTPNPLPPVTIELTPKPAATAASQRFDFTFGVRQTPQGVLFVYPLALGPRIAIAGDHNGWSGEATVARFNPALGVHEACLNLPVGRFKYRLVIGGRWVADPFNPMSEPNPFGDTDSVFDVQPAEFFSPPAPMVELPTERAVPSNA